MAIYAKGGTAESRQPETPTNKGYYTEWEEILRDGEDYLRLETPDGLNDLIHAQTSPKFFVI